MCNPAELKKTAKYTLLPDCIEALEDTMESSENCLSKGTCGKGDVGDGTCKYEPIGLLPDKTCDYIDFEKNVADLNKKCSNATIIGSFTYCNNLLKDSYPIALNCSITITTQKPMTTTTKKTTTTKATTTTTTKATTTTTISTTVSAATALQNTV